MGSAHNRRSGFTLVEIVIAMLITALIVLPLGMIVRSTIDAKVSVESEARARRLGPDRFARSHLYAHWRPG